MDILIQSPAVEADAKSMEFDESQEDTAAMVSSEG